MSKKYTVRANPGEGHKSCWRAGREWMPESAEIEVLDQDECPMVKVDVPPGQPPREQKAPRILGQVAFKQLLTDVRLAVLPVGDVTKMVDESKVREMLNQAQAMVAENTALKLMVVDLNAQIAKLSEEQVALLAGLQTLKDDNMRLAEKILAMAGTDVPVKETVALAESAVSNQETADAAHELEVATQAVAGTNAKIAHKGKRGHAKD